MDIVDLITENKIVLALVVGAVWAAWTYRGLIPSFKKSDEIADQEALRHLRICAVKSENQKLIALIKQVNDIMYDIHAGAKNED